MKLAAVLWILEASRQNMYIVCGMVVLPLKILRQRWLKLSFLADEEDSKSLMAVLQLFVCTSMGTQEM